MNNNKNYCQSIVYCKIYTQFLLPWCPTLSFAILLTFRPEAVLNVTVHFLKTQEPMHWYTNGKCRKRVCKYANMLHRSSMEVLDLPWSKQVVDDMVCRHSLAGYLLPSVGLWPNSIWQPWLWDVLVPPLDRRCSNDWNITTNWPSWP